MNANLKKVQVLNRDNTVSVVSMSQETVDRTRAAYNSVRPNEIVLMRVMPETPEEIAAEKQMPF